MKITSKYCEHCKVFEINPDIQFAKFTKTKKGICVSFTAGKPMEIFHLMRKASTISGYYPCKKLVKSGLSFLINH